MKSKFEKLATKKVKNTKTIKGGDGKAVVFVVEDMQIA